jgi:hypothetical protein
MIAGISVQHLNLLGKALCYSDLRGSVFEVKDLIKETSQAYEEAQANYRKAEQIERKALDFQQNLPVSLKGSVEKNLQEIPNLKKQMRDCVQLYLECIQDAKKLHKKRGALASSFNAIFSVVNNCSIELLSHRWKLTRICREVILDISASALSDVALKAAYNCNVPIYRVLSAGTFMASHLAINSVISKMGWKE